MCQGGSGSQRCAWWQGWRRATWRQAVWCAKREGPRMPLTFLHSDVHVTSCYIFKYIIYAAWACHRGSIVFVHNTEVWYHRDPQVVYYQCELSTNLPNCETHGLRSSPSIHPSIQPASQPASQPSIHLFIHLSIHALFLVHTYCVYIENDRII